MIGSTRFQQGSLTLVKNKTTDDSWFFRFYEDREGKRVHRNIRIGRFGSSPIAAMLRKPFCHFAQRSTQGFARRRRWPISLPTTNSTN